MYTFFACLVSLSLTELALSLLMCLCARRYLSFFSLSLSLCWVLCHTLSLNLFHLFPSGQNLALKREIKGGKSKINKKLFIFGIKFIVDELA